MHGTFEKPRIAPEQYRAYEALIRDGQIEPHEVPALLTREPDFAKWLADRNYRIP